MRSCSLLPNWILILTWSRSYFPLQLLRCAGKWWLFKFVWPFSWQMLSLTGPFSLALTHTGNILAQQRVARHLGQFPTDYRVGHWSIHFLRRYILWWLWWTMDQVELDSSWWNDGSSIWYCCVQRSQSRIRSIGRTMVCLWLELQWWVQADWSRRGRQGVGCRMARANDNIQETNGFVVLWRSFPSHIDSHSSAERPSCGQELGFIIDL